VRAAATSGHPDALPRIAQLERDADPEVAAAARAARERLRHDPPSLAFTVLGGFALRRGGYAVPDAEWGPRRRAAQRLVRFLLAHRDAAVPEDELFEAFWPDRPQAAARRSLQVTVSSARAALGRQDAIKGAGRRYRLVLGERDAVDADEFERAARDALAPGGPRSAAVLAAAADRWRGEPLPDDRYEDWAAPWRARLVELYGRLLAALADASSAAGDAMGAVDAARRHVELDPLDEGARRRLMALYARAGRRGDALREYAACRRALVEAVGLEPAEETAALQRRILAGETV
jgi:DNA-binding SARP family transcriptional activator